MDGYACSGSVWPGLNSSDAKSVMEGDAGWGSAGVDEWGSVVASRDATKLAEVVLFWYGSKPERALSVVRDCVCLLEKEAAFSARACPAVPSPPTTPEPTRSSCLDALVVALNETCDGKSWYTSTKELQLASLEFCIACRNHQTVRMNVDERIPRRLLAAADAPPPHPKRLCRTRVPRLRARRVTWNMRTAAELRNPMFALNDADCLEFGNAFDDSLEGVVWPTRLETLEFYRHSPFDNPVDLVELPLSLQRLRFGRSFNRPIEQVSWPASLRSLEFGQTFNKPIEEVDWPPSLRHLKFGLKFYQPIQRATFPASLQQLIFGTCFNHPIEDVAWPSSLRKLKFGANFNQPIERATFPASLQKLIFGAYFNQPIEDVSWPACLQKLFLGRSFDQPVGNVRWPASLEEVSFGWFEESQDNSMLVDSWFDQCIGSSHWPASLRRLTVGGSFRQSLQGLGTWMPNLEALRVLDWDYDSDDTMLDSQNDSLLCGIEWPKGLRELTVLEESSLDGVVVPSAVQVYKYFLDLGY